MTCLFAVSQNMFLFMFFLFFFFKQKTAYEMRISDWSSDVCSSDLHFLLQIQFINQFAQQRTPNNPLYGELLRVLAIPVGTKARKQREIYWAAICHSEVPGSHVNCTGLPPMVI